MAIEKVDKRNQEALRVPPFKIEYWETQECRNEGYGEYFHDFNKQDMNEAVRYADRIFWDTISAAAVEVYNRDGKIVYALYSE